MYSDEDLDSAIDAGVLCTQDATAFRDYIARQRQSSGVDEEHFRLLTGFNDIFVVIALALLLSSLSWIGAAVSTWFGAALQTGAAWLLAEYFTGGRSWSRPWSTCSTPSTPCSNSTAWSISVSPSPP